MPDTRSGIAQRRFDVAIPWDDRINGTNKGLTWLTFKLTLSGG